jgi:hypothetical protein
LRGSSTPSTFCRLLSAFVVGPELGRAQVVLYRMNCHGAVASRLLRLPAPFTWVNNATDGFL